MTFTQLQQKFPTEGAAITHFIHIRYPAGIVCPHCHTSHKISLRSDRPTIANCNECHNTFSVFKNTIFEKTSVDLRKWFFAINSFLNAKKGFSAMQLQREIGVTYKTAWRMLNKIRTAMGRENLKDSFELLVEVDETYIGGKPRKINYQTLTEENSALPFYLKRGRGTVKTPVIGVKERTTGRVYARVALADYNGRKLTGKQLLSVIEAVTVSDSIVISDDFSGYKILDHKKSNPRNYTHIVVNHSLGQFSARF